jgi:hypothetical protein
MKIGMMWIKDDKKKSMTDSLKDALSYYSRKYGRKAESCYVNVSNFAELSPLAADMKINIASAKNVFPNCLWIGMEKEVEGKHVIFTS